jgi:hypothetical protein
MIHAITATWAFDEAKKRPKLSRRCANCQSEKVAAEEKISESAACEECGTEIPPKTSAHSKMRDDEDNNE